MHQRILARLLIRPSLFSFLSVFLLALAILLISVWPYAIENPLLNDYLYGPYGIATALQKSQDIANFTTTFSVSPTAYNIMILLVAALVAAGVYAILQLISKVIVGSYDTWHALHDAGSSVQSVEKEIGTRLSIRLASLLLWLAYSYFFFSLIVPYSIFTTRVGIDNLLDWQVINGLIGFLVLLASLHLHVIFLRLTLLKPRVFGGKLDILEAIYEADEHEH